MLLRTNLIKQFCIQTSLSGYFNLINKLSSLLSLFLFLVWLMIWWVISLVELSGSTSLHPQPPDRLITPLTRLETRGTTRGFLLLNSPRQPSHQAWWILRLLLYSTKCILSSFIIYMILSIEPRRRIRRCSVKIWAPWCLMLFLFLYTSHCPKWGRSATIPRPSISLWQILV